MVKLADIRETSKNRRVFTVMSARIPESPSGITVYRENAFLKMTKLFGAQDVTTGGRDFDASFLVKGEDPVKTAAWLDRQRRNALLRVLGEDPDMDIREGCLRFQRNHIVESEEVLDKALSRFKTLIPYLKPHRW